MKGYGQFCPVAQALEVLAERWTLLVVRELLMGSTRFGELKRGVPRMSRTLLSQRLATLRDQGLVERFEGESGPEYRLTEAGLALRPIIEGIGIWGKQHVSRPPDEDLDPDLLMWDLQRRLNVERLPEERTVVLFRLLDERRGENRYWLHVTGPEIDLCRASLGFDVDLTVDAELRALTDVWMGRQSLAQAIRSQALRLTGNARLRREFPGWLKLSVFAAA
jgi:DNA-binding HxlR family transcriptional regulator